MSLDYFYSGKINSISAFNFCNDELVEIEEIFKGDNLSLNALESSSLNQEDLENAWKLIMHKINIESKVPDRIARKGEIIEFVESVVKKRFMPFQSICCVLVCQNTKDQKWLGIRIPKHGQALRRPTQDSKIPR